MEQRSTAQEHGHLPLTSARTNLETGKREAAKKSVTGHPDFAALETGIREAAQKITQAQASVAQSQQKAAADANEVTADVAPLKAAYDRVQQVFDKAVFPKQASDAPSDAKMLAREAMAFLQKEEEKNGAESGKEVSNVLSVVVTGPWRIFKTNILGEPIQYNLPIATAVQTESEKALNRARVYLSTMLTHEMKGVKMAPPYLGATVGDSYYIRPSAVK